MRIVYISCPETFGVDPYHTFANAQGVAMAHGKNGVFIPVTLEAAKAAAATNDKLFHTSIEEAMMFIGRVEIIYLELF